MAKTKYNLTDSANMLRGLASGDKAKQVDANGDGKKNISDVSTMMKIAAGWNMDTAMDPYAGREVTPSEYADKQAHLLGKVTDREPFSFSGTDSELYKAYAKQYKREGELAAKDTLSKVSARTGGVPSSYAVTATAAQQNQHGTALADKIPELYQMELNQYYNDAELDRADLNTLLSVKNNDLAYAGTLAEYGDYAGLEGMGIDTSKLKENDALERALTMYETTGDFSGLADLGYGTEYLEYLREQERKNNDTDYALSMFEATGDVRYLTGLGADTSYILKLREDEEREKLLSEAYAAAEVGDFSKLATLGVDTTQLRTDQAYANEAAALNNRSAAAALNNSYAASSKASSKYDSTDHTAMATRISMGPLYWDDSVKEYSRSVFGVEPIDAYYSEFAYDEEGKPTGVTYYEVLQDALSDKGVSEYVMSPKIWNESTDSERNNILHQWGASSYEDYLRKVAYKYL